MKIQLLKCLRKLKVFLVLMILTCRPAWAEERVPIVIESFPREGEYHRYAPENDMGQPLLSFALLPDTNSHQVTLKQLLANGVAVGFDSSTPIGITKVGRNWHYLFGLYPLQYATEGANTFEATLGSP